MPKEDDKNCDVSMRPVKSKVCSDKDCQENENVNIQPMKPQMVMQLPKPTIRRLCSDKNCQSTRCYKKKCYDKNCKIANNMC